MDIFHKFILDHEKGCIVFSTDKSNPISATPGVCVREIYALQSYNVADTLTDSKLFLSLPENNLTLRDAADFVFKAGVKSTHTFRVICKYSPSLWISRGTETSTPVCLIVFWNHEKQLLASGTPTLPGTTSASYEAIAEWTKHNKMLISEDYVTLHQLSAHKQTTDPNVTDTWCFKEIYHYIFLFKKKISLPQ